MNEGKENLMNEQCKTCANRYRCETAIPKYIVPHGICLQYEKEDNDK